ncbi:hypothetical protein K2W90_06645 [Candidatus Babeliales bacterium]|nr:hypothetical protein [Candidatus Babeliales bacterium]
MNKKTFFLFSILLLVSPENNAKTETSKTNTTTKTATSISHKLTGSNMKNLDQVFQMFPMGLLKINFAQRDIAKVIKSIDGIEFRTPQAETEKAFVDKHLETMLKPVKEFFDIITAYSSLVEPLVKESIIQHRNIKAEESILIDFLHSKKDIVTFCAQDITSVPKLHKLCEEILAFFKDINESVSDQTHVAYKTLVEQIKNKQKTQKK